MNLILNIVALWGSFVIELHLEPQQANGQWTVNTDSIMCCHHLLVTCVKLLPWIW